MSATTAEIAPGATHFAHYLPFEVQRAIVVRCLALGTEEAGFYTPIVRGGKPMSVRMLCLGRHWNALTYRYEDIRSDIDRRPVPALPPDLSHLAQQIARDAGFPFMPDICIVNWYREGSRMGQHQDKDESPESLDRGVPVISISLGDTALFRFGGLSRRDPAQTIPLESGDAFVFGGPSRLRFHGVARILPGTGPAGLGVDGRFNLTFRQF